VGIAKTVFIGQRFRRRAIRTPFRSISWVSWLHTYFLKWDPHLHCYQSPKRAPKSAKSLLFQS